MRSAATWRATFGISTPLGTSLPIRKAAVASGQFAWRLRPKDTGSSTCAPRADTTRALSPRRAARSERAFLECSRIPWLSWFKRLDLLNGLAAASFASNLLAGASPALASFAVWAGFSKTSSNTALSEPNLDSRVAEGLPWLAMAYVDMDWGWLVRSAKLRDR